MNLYFFPFGSATLAEDSGAAQYYLTRGYAITPRLRWGHPPTGSSPLLRNLIIAQHVRIGSLCNCLLYEGSSPFGRVAPVCCNGRATPQGTRVLITQCPGPPRAKSTDMKRASDHSTGPTTVCRACRHPRPMPDGSGHKTTLAVTGLRAMEINALESGCITCRILSKGFRMVTESFGLAPTQDGGDVPHENGIVDDERWLRIELNNMPGTSSLDLFDFITSTAISAFYTTSKLQPP